MRLLWWPLDGFSNAFFLIPEKGRRIRIQETEFQNKFEALEWKESERNQVINWRKRQVYKSSKKWSTLFYGEKTLFSSFLDYYPVFAAIFDGRSSFSSNLQLFHSLSEISENWVCSGLLFAYSASLYPHTFRYMLLSSWSSRETLRCFLSE